MIPSDCSRLRSRSGRSVTQDRQRWQPIGQGQIGLQGRAGLRVFRKTPSSPRCAWPHGSGIFPAQSAIHPSASIRAHVRVCTPALCVCVCVPRVSPCSASFESRKRGATCQRRCANVCLFCTRRIALIKRSRYFIYF